jgi:hypothetical protein
VTGRQAKGQVKVLTGRQAKRPPHTLAERSILLRHRMGGITKIRLAQLLGVCRAVVWKMETGRKVQRRTVERLEILEARYRQ